MADKSSNANLAEWGYRGLLLAVVIINAVLTQNFVTRKEFNEKMEKIDGRLASIDSSVIRVAGQYENSVEDRQQFRVAINEHDRRIRDLEINGLRSHGR